ncbi:hypothetical protein AnigIFM63604_001370 [Aspergillus niger]|uniref:Uncharacterized protein n=1 Tax=Aspergillus niger TaxID=5061 RepID=A0A9W6A8H2_ASPNG|nr:hypothetical protein AnigIFM59636_001388 [Aspergillus niger]GLA32485.1 hypothetical protein AnigIFM63326_000694 [Aspergillus niger]GLA55057.1 hypothetical protein AnigIFM63604_001370 [Aspergillus niger]
MKDAYVYLGVTLFMLSRRGLAVQGDFAAADSREADDWDWKGSRQTREGRSAMTREVEDALEGPMDPVEALIHSTGQDFEEEVLCPLI